MTELFLMYCLSAEFLEINEQWIPALKSEPISTSNALFVCSFNSLAELQARRDLREKENPLPPPINLTTNMSQLGTANFTIESEKFLDSSVFHMGSGITSSCSNSNKPMEPAHFLDACHLCNRLLGDGQDIYMYRGDTAFCSVECREQQIAMDEQKEKKAAAITDLKKGGQVSSSNSHENSNKGNFQAQTETVAAA